MGGAGVPAHRRFYGSRFARAFRAPARLSYRSRARGAASARGEHRAARTRRSAEDRRKDFSASCRAERGARRRDRARAARARVARPQASHRRGQPARQRRGPVPLRQRLHDDAQDRRHAGFSQPGEEKAARGARRAGARRGSREPSRTACRAAPRDRAWLARAVFRAAGARASRRAGGGAAAATRHGIGRDRRGPPEHGRRARAARRRGGCAGPRHRAGPHDSARALRARGELEKVRLEPGGGVRATRAGVQQHDVRDGEHRSSLGGREAPGPGPRRQATACRSGAGANRGSAPNARGGAARLLLRLADCGGAHRAFRKAAAAACARARRRGARRLPRRARRAGRGARSAPRGDRDAAGTRADAARAGARLGEIEFPFAARGAAMKGVPLLILGFVLVAAAAGGGGYWFAMSRSAQGDPPAASGEDSSGKKILYWYDPMVPQQHFDKPGKSPFMDMQLVPKYADDAGGEGTVVIDPRVAQNLGVRTAAATAGSVERRVEAVGSVAWNERAVFVVQARSGGFVERLHARAPLDPVAKGQPLVEILVPDWAAAQE